ncbi:phage portal protein [Paenibacillus oleatilyticus]|uniref:phage portal protein n=1 Tax=Paenibacillus oleatilyticus TaxID=2594886 RepID=UPI001C1F9959|nr:phage portal protein [Paenibacillus oleatilyticus]MBU7320284.1 phage portal protein [Paenibacillus oleatilyticus]
MALWDVFKKFRKAPNGAARYVKMMNGELPVFSQFGENIYASDLVQMAVDCIATEISKLQPKHIRTDNGGMQTIPASDINRLFKYAPNPLMTTRDFLEKVTWLLFLNYNAFVYPMFELVKEASGMRRIYTGFYPLQPTQVEFIEDENGKLFVRMQFRAGDSYTLPYADVIHLRKKFSVNDIMGGGRTGQPDNEALLKMLEIDHNVVKGVDRAVQTSLLIRGILKINTMMDDAGQQAERKRFEQAIRSSESGILPLDLKGEYIDLKPDPKLLDKDTLALIESRILRWYGVSLAILSGDYTDEQYQAFYERVLEPIVVGFGQAFSRTLFTDRELSVGNEIVFYQRDMQYMSMKSKLELLKIAGEQGLLQDNQKLALLGYPPVEGGERVTQSLNYIDKSIINQYQMKGGKPNAEQT